MKELQTLIDKYEREASALKLDLNNTPETSRVYEFIDGTLMKLRTIIYDLKNLNEKILNAQDESRSVTLHEQCENICPGCQAKTFSYNETRTYAWCQCCTWEGEI